MITQPRVQTANPDEHYTQKNEERKQLYHIKKINITKTIMHIDSNYLKILEQQ